MFNIASIVLGDSKELEPKGSKRPKNRQEKSARVEPGNLSNKDILAAMS